MRLLPPSVSSLVVVAADWLVDAPTSAVLFEVAGGVVVGVAEALPLSNCAGREVSELHAPSMGSTVKITTTFTNALVLFGVCFMCATFHRFLKLILSLIEEPLL